MHLKSNFLFFLILLLNINLYSQKTFFNYEKIQVEDIPLIEKIFNSKVIDSKMDYVNSENGKITNYGKLKLYRRESDKSFGVIDAQYVYAKNDNIVKKVNYFWVCPKNIKLKEYSNQFDKTVEQISAEMDIPIGEQGKINKIIEEDMSERFERRITWNYKDAKITTVMIWSEENGAYLSTEIEWKQ